MPDPSATPTPAVETRPISEPALRAIDDDAGFKATEGVFTYVAVDADGRPQSVAARAAAG